VGQGRWNPAAGKELAGTGARVKFPPRPKDYVTACVPNPRAREEALHGAPRERPCLHAEVPACGRQAFQYAGVVSCVGG